MLGTRQLGSFSLAGGPVVLPGPTVLLWRETDAEIVSPASSDAEVVGYTVDAGVARRDSDAEVVPYGTDADLYL
jgi:hypothetical protein